MLTLQSEDGNTPKKAFKWIGSPLGEKGPTRGKAENATV